MQTVILQADRENDGEDECRCFEKQLRYRAHRSGEFLFSFFFCTLSLSDLQESGSRSGRLRDPDSGNVLAFFKISVHSKIRKK
jgi:hypothetical protein